MRVSVTTLESFRLFMEPEQEWMTEADLIASIKGEFTPNRKVVIGLAFHSILEEPAFYRVSGGYLCGGFSFDEAEMAPMFGLIDRRGLSEVKTTGTLRGVTLATRADHILGSQIHEYKSTVSTFNPDKYLASCQWRAMCHLFDASSVTYHVASLYDHDNGVIQLKGVDSMTVYPYPAMKDDLITLIDGFTDFVTARGLDGILREHGARRASEAA